MAAGVAQRACGAAALAGAASSSGRGSAVRTQYGRLVQLRVAAAAHTPARWCRVCG